jgi:hypothetical protein
MCPEKSGHITRLEPESSKPYKVRSDQSIGLSDLRENPFLLPRALPFALDHAVIDSVFQTWLD